MINSCLCLDFVTLKIVADETFVYEISFIKEPFDGEDNEVTSEAKRQLCEYFEQKRTCFDLKLRLKGTEFQRAVWEALTQIEYGKTKSYQDIARQIGSPKACRAVGMACNRNPVAIVVPCHRVVGTSGKLTGYAGGLGLKERLLKLESSHQS